MESFLCAYDKFLKKATSLFSLVAGALVVFCGFAIVYEIVCRGIFNAPTEWVMEISTYCIVVAGFLGMAVTYAGKKHIHVDILVTKLEPRLRTWVELVTTALGAYYCLIFTTESWKMAMLSWELNNHAPTTLGTPLWLPQISIPLGMLLLFLQLVRTFLGDLDKIIKGKYEEAAK